METVTTNINPLLAKAPTSTASPWRLRSSSPYSRESRQLGLPGTDITPTMMAPHPPTRTRKPAILLPALLLAAIGFTAYLAVDTSITTFRSAWLRTDITRSGNGIQSAPRFDFQEQPIPGPFASFQNQWKSFLQQLPLLAASHGNENPSSP